MEYSLPDSSVHGIFQTRILEWVAISYSRGVFPTQGSNPHLLRWFNTEPHGKFLQLEIWHHEDLQDLELTPKRCPFHYRGLECKSRKSRKTWSNRQIWPWNTEWGRAKTNRVLPREHIGHSKHPLPKTQEMTLYMDITTWSIPKSDWLYSLQPKMKKL